MEEKTFFERKFIAAGLERLALTFCGGGISFFLKSKTGSGREGLGLMLPVKKGRAKDFCGSERARPEALRKEGPRADAKRPSASGPWKARRKKRAKNEPHFRPEKEKNENAGG